MLQASQRVQDQAKYLLPDLVSAHMQTEMHFNKVVLLRLSRHLLQDINFFHKIKCKAFSQVTKTTDSTFSNLTGHNFCKR